mmetsp:Transcript_13636/g.43552  ORF Transcript_13636/g.43552 Transcript_13636/m.43552 type:complete len:346 (+) Transcript_13636:1-1038(+)
MDVAARTRLRTALRSLTPWYRTYHARFVSTRPSMHVFDRQVKLRQRNRAAAAEDFGEYDYLRDEIAERLCDRLLDIKRKFPAALDLGCGAGSLVRSLGGRGGITSILQLDASAEMAKRAEAAAAAAVEAAGADPEGTKLRVETRVADEEAVELPAETFDLVMSNLSLHWVNDLPSVFAKVRAALKPDGVFLGAMLGGETLRELRSSFVLAEQERRGGIAPHVSPFAHVPDVGGLLQGAGFALPTVDTDVVEVPFADAAAVMSHLQRMGESFAGSGAQRALAGPETLLATASVLEEMYGVRDDDGTLTHIPCTFQVIYFVAWAPHESQPQPKRRGSAGRSLQELGE